ncbi:MAG TPA: class I SAM-dependent methyltransferase [Aestuariivirgaceae bacterium]|nr:class I SAM-dependent methyltransferase [Aestuariivirgaceae bacterium]
MLTRLEKTLFRLEAQYACIGWAVQQISGRPGIVFELGLGNGRTFHHLRHLLPDRSIIVFERQVGSYPDCTPDPDQLILGDMAETLPAAARRFEGQVILAHSDVGTFEADHNAAMARIVGTHLPRALAPGAIVMSDLPLELDGAQALDLPAGARPGRYYLYRAA